MTSPESQEHSSNTTEVELLAGQAERRTFQPPDVEPPLEAPDQISYLDRMSETWEWNQIELLPQLLDDPTTRRMLREVNVQDVPADHAHDEETVEHAERDRWHGEEIHGAIASRWFRSFATHHMGRVEDAV